jgi:hypothetical protein
MCQGGGHLSRTQNVGEAAGLLYARFGRGGGVERGLRDSHVPLHAAKNALNRSHFVLPHISERICSGPGGETCWVCCI